MQHEQTATRMIVIVSSALWLLGCSHGNTNAQLLNSPLLPAAAGKVTLTDKDEANKTLQIVVHHLANPSELSPEAVNGSDSAGGPAQAYVVWIEPLASGSPQNVGSITPDKNLNATFTTTTTQRKFDVFITAEQSTARTSPTGPRLLQARISD